VREKLEKPWASWPAGAATIVLAVTALVGGAAGLGAHLAAPALCAGLVAGGGVLLGLALRDLNRAERLARSLMSGPAEPRRSLHAALQGVSAQMGAVRHRLGPVHPFSGAPLREQLLGTMRQSLAAAPGEGVLGVVRFTDFDLIARFDLPRAHAALRRFADGLGEDAGHGRPLGQIDRDCFGLWFAQGETAQDAHTALEAAVGRAADRVSQAGLVSKARVKVAVIPAEGHGGSEGELIAAGLALVGDAGSSMGAAEDRAPQRIAAREAFDLAQDVATAMAEGRLETVFQPVVALPSGAVVGAEALLRWRHPRLGSIAPERFVPMLEARGLGEALGRYVLAAACAQAAVWRAKGLGALTVAVNMGPQQLLDPDLPAFLKTLLATSGLEPRALELELTETVAMADPTMTKAAFLSLRDMGVALSADDFGKGFSSISYLKNLPFDKLKIDREFVAGLDARKDSLAICRALVSLGRDLGLSVLAEGVETQAEIAALQALGCRLFQGYYFSGPLGGEAFHAFARARAA